MGMKSPDARCIGADAPQGYGDFCLMGNDDPSLIISCPQPHASDWKHRKVLHGA
jgi:hypothetical protein